MKTQDILWGLVLVFVGTVLLLDNFNVIEFYWRSIWRLWPLILVISGANIIFAGNASKAGAAVSITITIAALAFMAYYGTRFPDEESGWADRSHRNSTMDKRPWSGSSFAEPYESAIKRAELNISGGATVYILEDTTTNLFAADVKRRWGNYSLQNIVRDSMRILNFRMNNRGRNSWDSDEQEGNKVTMKLNSRPLWDINLETGAGKTEFDLSPFKVSNLQVKGGAASFDVKLGEPESITNVLAETGVAKIKIRVPSSAGCKIELDSGLSSKKFEGFTQQEDGSYTTSNYNSASKKININLRGGLSDFEVDRY